MTRPLVTADDVVAAGPGGVIAVTADTIVTPLARDEARARGVTFPEREPSRDGSLEDRVRQVVARVLGAGGDAPVPVRAAPGVRLLQPSAATMQRFAHPGPPPGMDVRTGDVVTGADGSPMGVGYMTMTAGEFAWTFDYDEVQVVLEGELRLGGDGGGQTARAGDTFFIPKGSRVVFSTPTWARFVYVTHPADWGG